MNEPWTIQLFGGLRCTQEERVISRFRTHTSGALLAYLSFHLHRSHPREELMVLLWPDAETTPGRNRLKQDLASLRRQLEPPDIVPGSILLADRMRIRLNPATVTTDVAAFEMALRAATRTPDSAERIRLLRVAVELYQGELLPGYYEDWIVPERERLAEKFVAVLCQLSSALRETGELDGAREIARCAVVEAPWNETAHSELMRLYADAGQPAAVLRQYRQLERILREELGVTPSREVHDLAVRLAQSEARKTVSKTRRAQASVERTAEAPPLPGSILLHESEAQPLTFRPCLPLRFTRFFGREEELARLTERLTPQPAALITLTGAGGSGKTRIAIEAGECLTQAYRGAVWCVPLQDITDPRLIPSAIAKVLGLKPTSSAELGDLTAFLQNQPSLLILDNMEHLLAEEEDTLEDGAAVLKALREQVPSLTLLVTSRRLLRLEGEREFPISPLPTPHYTPKRPADAKAARRESPSLSPEHLMQVASVALFADRAQAIKPDFQVTARNAGDVAELCARLEGIPLALELAAAQANMMAPAQMLARWQERFDLLKGRRRDAADRHRTLRATIEWSYHLLSPKLQCFFAWLSVFRGGWTVHAAEAVCEESDALDYLTQLRECSLVLADETELGMRFRMLETLREYAGEQLSVAEVSHVQRRHVDYFTLLAEQAEPELQRSEQTVWLGRLETEHDNLRAALAWTSENCVEVGLRLAGALRRFWGAHGHLSEGREHLQTLLNRSDSASTIFRAKVLLAAGYLAYRQGDHAFAQGTLEESLVLFRQGGEEWGIAQALTYLGMNLICTGDYTQARSHHEEALRLHHELKNYAGEGLNIAGLGLATKRLGDYDTARTLYQQSLVVRQQAGDKSGIAGSLNLLGVLAFEQKDYATAHAYFMHILAIDRELGNKQGINVALHNLAMVARAREDYAASCVLEEEALRLSRELGHREWEANNLSFLGSLAVLQKDYETARTLYQESLTIYRALGNRRYGNICLDGMATIAQALGQAERATRLFGASERLREVLGVPPSDELLEHQANIAALRDTLSEEIFSTAWKAGWVMTWEQAAAYAFDESE